MTLELVKSLILKGAIKQGTCIDAYYLSRGLSCQANARVSAKLVILSGRKRPDGTIYFECKTDTGERKLVELEDILAIDGMAIERYAMVYGVTGPVLKRRGRPRNEISSQNS